MGLAPAQIRLLGGGATQFSLNAGNPLVLAGQIDTGLVCRRRLAAEAELHSQPWTAIENQTNVHGRALDFAPRMGFAWAPRGGTPGSNRKDRHPRRLRSFLFAPGTQSTMTAQRYNGVNQQQFVVVNPDFFPTVPAPAELAQFATTQAIHTVSPLLTRRT